MDSLDADSLTAEKNLWQVWRMGRNVPRNRFNDTCTIVIALILVLYVCKSRQAIHDFSEQSRAMANSGIGFSATILGFLVAGFAIFSTMAKPSLMIAYSKMREQTSGLSYLKYSFSVFYETFAVYLGFSALCIAIIVFGAEGGLAARIIAALPSRWQSVVANIIARTTVCLIGTWYILLILELKSFIFNIYHNVMASIRWMSEFPDDSGCRYVPPTEPKDQKKSSAAIAELSDPAKPTI